MTNTPFNKNLNRVWEIDFIRGIAVILMVIFHFVYDLSNFAGVILSYQSGFWYFVGKSAALLFIATAGVSAYFSTNALKHGIKIFLYGMLLTAITYLFDSTFYIKFGILHCLGMSIIIYSLISFLSDRALIIISIILLAAGVFVDGLVLDIPYLFPLGLTSHSFASSDYYPLIPWLGLFLLSSVFGRNLYKHKKSLLGFSLADNFICVIGRNSLFIYLIHQPILIGLIKIFS